MDIMQFKVTEISYMGNVMVKPGLKPDGKKIKAVAEAKNESYITIHHHRIICYCEFVSDNLLAD